MSLGSFTTLRNKSNGYAHADAPPDAKRWQRILTFLTMTRMLHFVFKLAPLP